MKGIAVALLVAVASAQAEMMDRPEGIKIGQRLTLKPYVAFSATYDSLITVADSATSIFQANTEYHDMFVPGSPMTVTVGKDEYTATVVTAQELGIVKTGVSPKGKENVYLMLDEMNFDLEDGDRGSVTLILEQSLDTLKLPKGAVGRVNGETAVYYLDEDGVKRYKLVTTGVTNGPEIEILEGVTEGEAVIAN